MPTTPIPDEYFATPFLICRNAPAALEWYGKAFGAVETITFGERKAGFLKMMGG